EHVAAGDVHVAPVKAGTLGEQRHPVALQRPAQRGAAQARRAGHGIPGGGLLRVEAVGALDLHTSSDEPAVPRDSSPIGAGPSPPPSPVSVIPSSTAESKSSPSPSPNSLPI